jgi:hypothetical protein
LPSEWTPSTEIAVPESDPAGCETKRLREWLGIFCRNKGGAKGVTVTSGTEVMAGALPGEALLVAPLIPGQDLKATFVAFDGATRELTVKVDPAGSAERAEIAFSKPLPPRSDIPAAPASSARLCECVAKVTHSPTCAASSAPVDDACLRTYPSDCARLVACSIGDPTSPPKCARGEALAGAAHRCRPLCSASSPCTSGRCTEWQGGSVCM